MKYSKIFTKAESELLDKALQDKKGWRKDPNGTFCGRIKPKILEMLEIWLPKREELLKIIEPKYGKK